MIDPLDFVAHRAVWSFAVLAAWLLFVHRGSLATSFRQQMLGDFRSLLIGVFASLMIAINWLTFVWAVSTDHAIDASLGYYICPQVVVLLGVIFLHERLTRVQWIAVLIAGIGVTVMTQSGQGKVWIGLIVAVAFGIYALVKKKTQYSAAEGLCLDTGLMVLPAVLFLAWRFSAGVMIFPESVWLTIALLGCGVATVAPLLLYVIAVKHLSLSTMGLLQFIGPTMQFFLGVFAFSEPVNATRITGFVFVWIGVSIYLFALHRRTAIVKANPAGRSKKEFAT